MIRAASRHAMEQLRRDLDTATARVSAAKLTELAEDLYSVCALLVAEPRLRRTVGDASTPAESRADLVQALLAGKVADRALDVVRAATSQRWSSPWDLTDGLHLAADDCLLRAAEREKALGEVEDELFRFERVLDSAPQLAAILDEQAIPSDRRVALLNDVLAAKANPITKALLVHVVSSTRKRRVQFAIDDILEAAAARRDRSVARVVSAVELSAAQEARLSSVLSALYGRAIDVRTSVEPTVQGGLVIRVGDEVIDGSVAARFAAARAALAH